MASKYKNNKKAYLVNIDLEIRVTIDETLDPNIDPEFDKAVMDKLKFRLLEEGESFILEGINEFNEDKECPYDPEFDD